jgi:transcription elongation factor Elf1
MPSDWSDSRASSSQIKPCSICGAPPAASVQVGSGTSVFWFECKTCGRKTQIRAGFHEARQEWNALQ